MDSMNQHIASIVLVLLTGLSAGLCFTWSNAITPGIGRLDDFVYLRAFQQMNRSIISPLFIIVFFGPFFLGIINLYLFKNASSAIIWLLIFAIALYFFGVLLVTIFGNVPLNELLDKTDLSNASLEDLRILREQFEDKWNRLHLIRTVTAITSFIILIISLVQNTK
ncbi:MAG: DUF1772 domain-containing protein [Algibacter sp.]|uniref:anthrone oxygenase family protein n=1 Tax=Algibacter sp. TaxID=1872428 RepID=UPI0026349328|nr:DUF1772 domain-containing protein [Algibacter sp.]MDG1729175.1 DUF1772 domain-containing protein [Algibacter sp.]MDG2178432.1 DUF1772 domain-containing protein [Algibacter sp.]